MIRTGVITVALVSYFSISQAYDYVVVGGGTAGLTVANRLSEDQTVTVAVVEAGPYAEQLPEVYIPGLAGTGLAANELVYQYPTIEQVNLNERKLSIKAGKALGGSTIVNSMIFTRASRMQYDAWGSLNNDQEWNWDGLLPFFKKSEIFTPPNAFQVQAGATYEPSVHGFNGPIKVGFPNYFFNQSKMWREACNKLGIRNSPDLADGDPHAVGINSNSLDAAANRRCSAACAYYTPIASTRPNLTIIYNATVSRIIWSNTTNGGQIVAQGVEYVQNGHTVSISAEKEVIVSAGTIGTPKVLELSGIGNSTILKAAGVEPVLDLPSVGENLAGKSSGCFTTTVLIFSTADHVHGWVTAFTNMTTTKDQLKLNKTLMQEQLDLWNANQTGMLSAASRSLGLFSCTDLLTFDELADLTASARRTLTSTAARYSNGNPALAAGISAQLTKQIDMYSQEIQLPMEINLEPGYSGPTSFDDRPKTTYTSINAVLYTPLSRGRTHITTSDPAAFPALDPNYFDHVVDIAVHVAGIKLARLMLQTPPMDSIFAGEFEPGRNITTDAQIAAWLKSTVGSDNHEVGTAAMMPQTLGGVVGTSLKVYGVYNVRVVDASVIPFPLNAHIASTVYAIGEKAADMIKRGV
ncbi:alcohol oxidase [Hysterangium stoloniferum]|nr:alcohol oxidase [Hysterangium stoloniferum]